MANFQADLLKQNINTDVVYKEFTLEEKNEIMDKTHIFNDNSTK